MGGPRFDDLIGLPYEEGGLGPERFDCFGVVLEVFRRLGKSMDVPAELIHNFGESGFAYLRECPKTWEFVGEPQLGDLALIRGAYEESDGRRVGFARHVAANIGGDEFLHSTRKTGVSIVRWTAIKPFTIGLVRNLEGDE